MDQRLATLIRCPRCRSELRGTETLRCRRPGCDLGAVDFPTVAGKPVLIDFADSIVDREGLLRQDGASPLSRSRNVFRRVREWAAGRNKEAGGNCALFLEECRAIREPGAGGEDPCVLVIGGGGRGSGTEALYAASDIRVVGTDVYASPLVELVADGHHLPFADASVQGVWIQAVLEHVVSPETVVAEIHRVLVDGGVIYAETPFIQPVHERAYDFTRFTRSGHRWLFRRFAERRSGTIGGPAESLLWAIRYLARALFRSEKVGSLFAVAFFWLRYLDNLIGEPYRADAATGVYFLGTKREEAMAPRDLVDYFPGVRGA